MPGATLAPVAATRSASSSDERERRRRSAPGRTAPPAGRAPGRVDEGGVAARRRSSVGDVGAAHVDRGRPARAPRGWPRRRRRSSGSRSTPATPEPARGEGEQVAADAAAQVGDRGEAERGEPRGAVRGDHGPGGLLEPVGGPEQPVARRRRTWRGPAAAAAPGSGRRRRRSRVVPGGAAARGQRQQRGRRPVEAGGGRSASSARARPGDAAASSRRRGPRPEPTTAAARAGWHSG